MQGQCVRHADGNVVEQAEAHRPAALGVMPGRPDRTERSATFALEHEVGAEDDRARGMARRVERMRTHGGVGVEVTDV